MAREKELAKVSIKKEDVELIVKEMEISKDKAERTLREHAGNIVDSLASLTNWINCLANLNFPIFFRQKKMRFFSWNQGWKHSNLFSRFFCNFSREIKVENIQTNFHDFFAIFLVKSKLETSKRIFTIFFCNFSREIKVGNIHAHFHDFFAIFLVKSKMCFYSAFDLASGPLWWRKTMLNINTPAIILKAEA